MRWLRRFLRPAPAYKVIVDPEPVVILATSCLIGLVDCLADANTRRHEGVAFLLGQTDGSRALCIQSVRPRAVTTAGSFHVPAAEMARVVALATDFGFQIVAQVHTHPTLAAHSDGDEDGANIRFDGFISIVIPDYGAALPTFRGAAVYVFRHRGGWKRLPLSAVHVADGAILL